MENRNEKRNFNNKQKEMLNLLSHLDQFCFHGSGADNECHECCFEKAAPCPLAVFHNELSEKFINS